MGLTATGIFNTEMFSNTVNIFKTLDDKMIVFEKTDR